MEEAFVDRLGWVRDGAALTGSGGWRLAFSGRDRLARMDAVWQRLADRDRGPAPLTAFLAATFDDSSALPSVLRVPRSVRRGETAWEQAVDAGLLAELAAADDGLTVGLAGEEIRGLAAPGESAGRAGHRRLVEAALGAIAGGAADKIVVARDEYVRADDARCARALEALAASYPQTWTFAVDGLFGATPELMIARQGDRFRTRVLAGTAGDAETLLGDPRRVAEHRLAADAVLGELAGLAVLDDERPAAYPLQLPNLWHLATDISGRVADPASSPLRLITALHPTPAVAGVPTKRAVELINEFEPRDRGRYAGPVGWMDAAGNGEIGLALRCGQREPGGVRCYAGGGIVAGADPEWEYAETEVKLQPMRRALRV